MAQLKDLIVNGIANFIGTVTAPTPSSGDNSTKVATTAFVQNTIGTLDGTITGTAGTNKTLSAFSETDGKVSATFSNISITKSQVSDFPTSMPASDVSAWAKAANKPTYTASEVGAQPVNYGYCTTAAATQAKAVTISTVTALTEGVRITVRFQYAQTYNGVPTLNVSNLGAKNILLRDSTNGVRYLWDAGAVLEFTYNGTGWVMENGGFADTTYYGITKLATAYNSTSQALALTPRSLHYFAEATVAQYYSTSATYAVGDIVRYNNYLYRCNTAITTAEAWTAAHWTAIMVKDYLKDEIFIATYGTTTLAEIGAAFNAGKAIFCSSTNTLFPLNVYNGGNLAIFGAVQGTTANNMALTLFVNFSDNWSTTTANPVLKTGATMTGALVAQNNTDYTTAQTRNIILSTSEPTANDGGNGDVWLVYTA